MALNSLPSNQVQMVDWILNLLARDFLYIVDMTVGNGNDSLKLLNKYPQSNLIGFDIQKKAIEASKEKLKSIDTSRYRLINDSHIWVDKYADKADLIIYNLGYLPGSDKSIVTKGEDTLLSLKKSLKLIDCGGIVIMVFYLGHEGGYEEYNICLKYIKSLNQKTYTVLEFNYLNQINNPPKLVVVERLK